MNSPVTVGDPSSKSIASASDFASRAALATGLLIALSLTKAAIHLLLAGRYGYFRDELYFLDCARHPAWGYVDHAPLIALYSRVALLFGGSLFAVRAISAIAGALLVALTMLIAWRLGAGRYVQALAGLSIVVSTEYLAGYSILHLGVFEVLYWMGCIYVLIRIIQTGNSQLWLWFVGMMVTTLPWHWLGLQGQWRRVANFNYADPIIAGWGPWVVVSLAGGVILLLSALLFVRNLAVLHRGPALVLARPLYALAVHPPHRVPAALNGFALWNVLVLVLMVRLLG